jgi:hypothetical protein
MHMAKYVSANNVNNITGENYDAREIDTDKKSWIHVVNGKKYLKKTKLPSGK